jgi:hypothetical protein
MPIFLHQSCESPKHLHQTNFEKYAQQTMLSNCIFGCGKSGPKCARSFGPFHPKVAQLVKYFPIWSPWLAPSIRNARTKSLGVKNIFEKYFGWARALVIGLI